MSKAEDILLSKPPIIKFAEDGKYTLEDLKMDLIGRFIVEELKKVERR